MRPPSGEASGGELGSLLDGRYRIEIPVAEGILLRELRGRDEKEARPVSLWLPHRQVAPAFEDIEEEIAAAAESLPAGCRRLTDRGRQHAYVVGVLADHVGPRPRRQPHTREVVAGWFRAVAGIIARNHQAGRWHGLLTCDDLAILDGRLVASGFGFWVRADPEAIAAVLSEPDAAKLRELCAPEVLACAIGPAADLWALGRCTLALATGSGDADPLAALRDRHPPLARLLAGLLHEDPEARPGDLRALSEAVTRALETPYLDEGKPTAAFPSSPPLAAARGPAAQSSPSSQTPQAPPAARPAGPGGAAPVFEPDPEGDDTDSATYEPGTGTWSNSVRAAIASLSVPTPLVVQPWSPLAPRFQVISMKEPTARPAAPREAPKLAPPRIRPLESVLPPSPRPSPAALGTIAPPRSRTQPVAPRRRWPLTLLIIALALLALGAAAFAVSRWT